MLAVAGVIPEIDPPEIVDTRVATFGLQPPTPGPDSKASSKLEDNTNVLIILIAGILLATAVASLVFAFLFTRVWNSCHSSNEKEFHVNINDSPHNPTSLHKVHPMLTAGDSPAEERHLLPAQPHTLPSVLPVHSYCRIGMPIAPTLCF